MQRMIQRNHLHGLLPCFFSLFLLCVISSSVAFGIDPRTVKPGYGCALLNHGKVIKGEIAVRGSQIVIKEDRSATITLRGDEIRFIGKDLESLYDYQVRSTVQWRTGDEINLAEWCIANGLIDQAGKHYLKLKETIPDRPSFKRLEELLKARLIEDKETRLAFGLPATPEVSQASYQGDRVLSADSIPPSDIPPVAIAEFREQVLPILRNRCGMVGCHGLQSKLELCFPPAKSAAQLSQKSLIATLKYVDRDSPNRSRLIALATNAHGSQKVPGLDPGKKGDLPLIQQITDWVEHLGTQDRRIPLANSRGSVSMAQYSAPATPANNPQGSKGDGPTRMPIQVIESPDDIEFAGDDVLMLEDQIRKLEQIEKAQTAKDPHDPSAFNALSKGKAGGR